MKITVINGTEKRGVTFRLKEIFLDRFRNDAEITEFFLPRDCPNCCAGCTVCFLKDERLCKDAQYVQKIERAMLEADLLVFTSPAYVFHATGAMKTMLDHFGYRWMPHRPAQQMFGKRAVIITQCLGAGGKSAAKDIKDSLSWWGISWIKAFSFKLMSEVQWEKIPDKKKEAMTKSLVKAAERMHKIDHSKPAHTNIVTKLKFHMVRMLQKNLGKKDPEYTDYNYWKSNGWTGSARPWKRNNLGQQIVPADRDMRRKTEDAL
jgi:multimeric flavodoxin WrbA